VIPEEVGDVRSGPILLKKSVLADERNLSGPLMRSARGDAETQAMPNPKSIML
jgi:hypothetical protein